eukprot:1956217-Amphidinium_carterae.1
MSVCWLVRPSEAQFVPVCAAFCKVGHRHGSLDDTHWLSQSSRRFAIHLEASQPEPEVKQKQWYEEAVTSNHTKQDCKFNLCAAEVTLKPSHRRTVQHVQGD